MDNITPEESKKKMSESRKGRFAGENFHNFFTKKEKNVIKAKMNKLKINKVNYKGIDVERFLKDKNITKNRLYEYILSNGEDYFTFFTKQERSIINKRLYKSKDNITTYKDITIKKIKKGENKNG